MGPRTLDKRHEDLRVGDSVKNVNGEWVRVHTIMPYAGPFAPACFALAVWGRGDTGMSLWRGQRIEVMDVGEQV